MSTKVMLFFQIAKLLLSIVLIFLFFPLFSFQKLHFLVEIERIM